MTKSFPFPIKGIHSDNGAEFINETVLKYSQKHNIAFTRGRPYKKNDNAHIEQKNYAVIRKNTGYLRYDKPEHAAVLKELYKLLNLYANYFQPVMMVLVKQRTGAKVYKKYSAAMTPYQRLMASPDVSAEAKAETTAIFKAINPVALKKQINEYQAQLINMAAPIRQHVKAKKIRRTKILPHVMPKSRRDFVPQTPNPFLERQRVEELRRAAQKAWEKRKVQ